MSKNQTTVKMETNRKPGIANDGSERVNEEEENEIEKEVEEYQRK